MKILLGIDSITPSLNKLLSWHWSKRAKFHKMMSIELLLAIKTADAYSSMKANKKRRLTIARFSKKLCDQDNLTGGMKPLIDAIKGHGLLVDDSPEWMELIALQFKATKQTGECERMEITLEDL